MTPRELKKFAAADLGIIPANRLGGRFATNLRQLADALQAYGPTAVARARWSAITRWLMDNDKVLTHPGDVAAVSVRLVREACWARSGLPHPEGRHEPVILDRISAESRKEALRVALDTFRDWRRAGRPYLNRNQVTRTHQYTLACIKRANETANT